MKLKEKNFLKHMQEITCDACDSKEGCSKDDNVFTRLACVKAQTQFRRIMGFGQPKFTAAIKESIKKGSEDICF